MSSLSVKDLASRLARRRKATKVQAPNQPPKYTCPICDERMSIEGTSDKDWLGLKDTRVHSLHCNMCGMKADRVFHPLIGYYPSVVI